MLKILHTADIHLGKKFSGLGPRGAAQREQLKATFKKVIATALEEKVAVVLIAGDLFDSNEQPQSNIDLVIEQFNLLGQNGIPVCLVPGTHDPLDSSSIYRKVDFEAGCPNLKLFADENVSFREYPDLDLTVYGKPNLSNRSYASPLKGLERRTSTRFHVAMAHGSFYIPEKAAEDDHVFRLEEIRSAAMDYIALGHWHEVYACSEQPPAWYPGPPEWISGQSKRGAVLLVGLTGSDGVTVEPGYLGLRDYDEIEIDMSDIPDRPALEARICRGAGENLVRRATLKGLRDQGLLVSPDELESGLSERFFHLSITDRSHPRSTQISDDGERLIRSRFIQLMNEQIETAEGDEKEIAGSALQYGVALLDGRDVL